jgi:hypothetical protein
MHHKPEAFSMSSITTRLGASICLGLVTALVASFVTTSVPSAQSSTQWKSLFNGKDLSGWTVAAGRRGGGGAAAPDAAAPAPAPAPSWKVEDGVLVGGQGGGRGSLVSNEQFKDFELELDFVLTEHGTECSAELVGPKQENASADRSCLYNSGITFRTGYQLNIGRREAGEFIGVVVHRTSPQAIRGNVLWLDTGDEKFPNLRKKQDWNSLRIMAKGSHITVTLNGQKICDLTDDPKDPAEARWKEAGPISIQWPPAGESGGVAGFVKYRNIRIREL